MNREEIIAICTACDEVKTVAGSLWCGICKCNVGLKATIGPMLGKRCPLGKW